MAAINPLRTQVSIKEWDLKESQKAPSQEVFRHLDLGSANYRPGNRPQSVDSKIYSVLSSNVDRVIAEHPKYKKFTFYLNDLSSEGLDRAASYLAQHLGEEHQDKGIKVKIVKIVKNFFEFDPMPSVNSASLLNPDLGELFGTIVLNVLFNDLDQAIQDDNPLWKTPVFLSNGEKIVRLFQRVTAASQEGLLVREIDVGSDMAKKVNKRLSDPNGVTMAGLHFVDAEEEAKSIPSYISSCDGDFFAQNPNRGSITYLVTQAPQFSELSESYLDFKDLLPTQDDASVRAARRLVALRAELEKARKENEGVVSGTSQNDASHRLAALQTEFKIAEQECEGYETEGRSVSVPGNSNLVLIRDQSEEEKLVEGKPIETVGQVARDDQGMIIPNRVMIHDNQVHHGEVLVYSNGQPQLDPQGRLRVRLFDRVHVWGTEQKSDAAYKKAIFVLGNSPEQQLLRQAMTTASEDAYQKHCTARQRVVDLRKELIRLRKAEAVREKVADLENQIAQLEKEAVKK